MRFDGKIIVVTGGNSGIGLATARAFVRQGARVIIIGRNTDAVNQAVSELGGDTLGVTADVARVEDLAYAFHTIRDRVEGVDVLFANAGILQSAPIAECNEAMFDAMFATNVKGAFFTVQQALPVLKDGAAIIFTTSVKMHIGVPGSSIYAASKAALLSLAKTLAIELAERRMRVNVVCPGPTITPLFQKIGVPETAMEQAVEHMAHQIPLKRLANPEDIASGVLFLASDEASYITGQEIVIDGGRLQL